ncbi:LLM class flavin-dependent oxidoreductase [Alteromonas sp. 1_MG-2023]|uniref:LLM class flavin-dependent oxidoreductase n=1 Tax=Alteromonas sp. 1_MG-2023 TaxID=3062669 RepID=UPI0026E1EAA5|nr:LLM class flavin-dependent oxidoreductase [Alteromonas sp. 1_MG-2023]MDO6568904.1 LLM class flavin-dependent oxidoreductase [Alteromonas sp. 1_MG-2023]
MSIEFTDNNFAKINTGFGTVFNNGHMSIGLVVPIESYPYGPVPTMQDHIERVQLAEKLDFKAVWVRDVLFNVPSFGDAGQMYDPFVYLGVIAALTKTISLGVASLVLPQRHAAQVAKAAASIDVLSGGRLILGVASGDRPEEYPAINRGFDDRGDRFRESVNTLNA